MIPVSCDVIKPLFAIVRVKPQHDGAGSELAAENGRVIVGANDDSGRRARAPTLAVGVPSDLGVASGAGICGDIVRGVPGNGVGRALGGCAGRRAPYP